MWLTQPLIQFIRPEFPVWGALGMMAAILMAGIVIGQMIWK